MQRDNFDNIRSIIENRANDNWTTTPIAWQDVPYYPVKNEAYIAINTLFGESENAGLNSMNNVEAPIRENGVLLIQCFTAANIGSGTILRLAGEIRELYQNTDESGLAFYAGSINRIGELNDFLQYNVEIPFYYQ